MLVSISIIDSISAALITREYCTIATVSGIGGNFVVHVEGDEHSEFGLYLDGG